MSTFNTSIPVDVAGVKRLLPKQHFLETIIWNPITQAVDVVWSTPALVTPFATPQPFPIQNLHDQSLPPGVNYRATPAAVPSETAEHPKTVDKPKARALKPHRR